MRIDYLLHVRQESERFAEVLRGVDPAARVPSCPDWDAADLLWHLTEVQWFWGTIVAEHRQHADGLEPPQRPADPARLHELFATQSTRLVDALGGADPAEEVYMWAEDKTVGYIRRRQAHEALIHRLDAELVVGDVTPLDAHLAADGVHEVLDVMLGGCPPWGAFTPTGPTVHVVAEDTGLTVPVVLGRFSGTDPDGTSYDEEDLSVRAADPSTPPAVTVRGGAADLDAWLWRRRDRSGISLTGDQEATDRFLALVARPID